MTNEPPKLVFNFYDNLPSSTVYLTWGLHKELSEVLLKDDNLFNLFTDTKISDTVLSICLAIRDQYGRKIGEFEFMDNLAMDSISTNLEIIFKYFEDFFFQNQLRMAQVAEKMKSLQSSTNT